MPRRRTSFPFATLIVNLGLCCAIAAVMYAAGTLLKVHRTGS